MAETMNKFQMAVAKQKKELAEREARKSQGSFSTNTYEEIPYVALEEGVDKVVRLLGDPILSEQSRNPTDPKKIYVGFLSDDSGKKFRCIAPNPRTHKDWILHKLINKVMAYDWDSNAVGPDGRKGVRVYKHAKTHESLFNRVSKNDNLTNKYEQGFSFRETVVWNVIDREDMQWHRENKKTKLLSKKCSITATGTFYEAGIPSTVYNSVVEDIVAMDGNTSWEEYDVVFRKLNSSPYYKVYHGIDDVKRINEEARAYIVSGKLTDEEKTWEQYNIDKLFKVCSYTKLKSRLGLLFQRVDAEFNTTFFNELSTLAEQEQAAWEAERSAKVDEELSKITTHEYIKPTDKPVTPTKTVVNEPTIVEQPKVEINTISNENMLVGGRDTIKLEIDPSVDDHIVEPMTEQVWESLKNGSLLQMQFTGITLMTEEEKALVVGVNMNTKQFVWDPRCKNMMYDSHKTNFSTPACVHVDPLDGTIFPKETLEPIPSNTKTR